MNTQIQRLSNNNLLIFKGLLSSLFSFRTVRIFTAIKPCMIFLACLCFAVNAQVDQNKIASLSEYEGRYEYIEDSQLELIAGPKNERLYAVLEGARYPLRPYKKDVFVNISGDEIIFSRNSNGIVIGYEEKQKKGVTSLGNTTPQFAKLSSKTSLDARMFIAKPAKKQLPYVYQAPKHLDDGIATRSLASNSDLAFKLSEMTTAIYKDAYPLTQSVLVYQDGALVFEEYFYEYSQQTKHQMRSATKTLSAILLGIALDTGLLDSIDEPILPYFGGVYMVDNLDERKANITLRHLLSMQSGFACNDYDAGSPGNESTKNKSDDWVKFMLDLPMQNAPGKVGMYCSGNVTLINKILELVTHKPLHQFANEVLFEPLGVNNYKWEFKPDRSSINNYNQAYMIPRDIMKLGIMIQNQGVWNNNQIVSSEWIDALSSQQSTIGETPYGYLYWLRYIYKDGVQRIEIPQISGNGGQKVIQLKDDNAVVVLTGGNYNAQSHTNVLLGDYIIKGLRD